MRLYLITQNFRTGYDTYSGAIVAALSASEARKIHPSGYAWEKDAGSWCDNFQQVEVKYIGKASPSVKQGVILASFLAG